jgi:hypothetical protein
MNGLIIEENVIILIIVFLKDGNLLNKNQCEYNQRVVLNDNSVIMLSECDSYYDGCNTCFVTDSYAIGGCTKKYCDENMIKKPICIKEQSTEIKVKGKQSVVKIIMGNGLKM